MLDFMVDNRSCPINITDIRVSNVHEALIADAPQLLLLNFKMKTPTELENEFNVLFEGLGYSRVSEIVGHSPTFANADYVNADKGIVVELKIIDKDFFENGGIIESLNTFVTVPKNIDEEGFRQYTFSLPNKNREGKVDTMEEPLRRVLKKANKQLRETKTELLKGEGIGFIVIALNMKTLIDPEKIRELVANLVSREFSSIAGFIICTPTWGKLDRETGRLQSMCLPTTEYGCSEDIRLSCNEIGQEWCKFINNGGHK
jgi:hypothetical protein